MQSGGKSVRSVGIVLHENRDLRIECWRSVGHKLLAFDGKHIKIEALECADCLFKRNALLTLSSMSILN